MSLWSRLRFIFSSKATAALDRVEDPRETLDYAYSQQQELLRKVRNGLIEVATSKRQLQQQTRSIETKIPRLEDQARRAMTAGREDLARISLQRKSTAAFELEDLQRQVVEVDQEEQKLTKAEQTLSGRIEEFRSRRNVMSARYTAAEAQVRVNEALMGVSGDLAELGMALGRAEEKTERMLARAAALGDLMDSDALKFPLGGRDNVERELREVAAAEAIEAELAALRIELTGGQQQQAPSTGTAS